MKPQTLDDKQAEKDRLYRKYRTAKREQWKALCEQEPRLSALRLAIRRTRRPAETVLVIADSWARRAEPHIRHAVLSQVERHAQRMQRQQGRAVLDDPLPPAVNVFLIAREMLALR